MHHRSVKQDRLPVAHHLPARCRGGGGPRPGVGPPARARGRRGVGRRGRRRRGRHRRMVGSRGRGSRGGGCGGAAAAPEDADDALGVLANLPEAPDVACKNRMGENQKIFTMWAPCAILPKTFGRALMRVQGSRKKRVPACEDVAGKAKKKLQAKAGTIFTKPGDHFLAGFGDRTHICPTYTYNGDTPNTLLTSLCTLTSGNALHAQIAMKIYLNKFSATVGLRFRLRCIPPSKQQSIQLGSVSNIPCCPLPSTALIFWSAHFL